MYPLVRELAVDEIPVTVTCRVLDIARQPYYRWLADPVTDAQLTEAHLANALFDAHRDDTSSATGSSPMRSATPATRRCDRTMWRVC
jgi:putative transposase